MDTALRPPFSAAVIAWSALRADPTAQAALRRDPGPGIKLPNSFLRHADEQSLAALAAVGRAIQDHHLSGFDDWGVVAGPRYLGRSGTAASLNTYYQEGAWGVSPHLIPHRSLHGVSGSISLALKSRGPNFGAGGGPGAAGDALLSAIGLLAEGGLPGVWVVVTGWQPESIPDRTGTVLSPSDCLALAMALVPDNAIAASLRLIACADDPEAGQRLEIEELLTACEETVVGTSSRWNVAGVRLELRPGGGTE